MEKDSLNRISVHNWIQKLLNKSLPLNISKRNLIIVCCQVINKILPNSIKNPQESSDEANLESIINFSLNYGVEIEKIFSIDCFLKNNKNTSLYNLVNSIKQLYIGKEQDQETETEKGKGKEQEKEKEKETETEKETEKEKEKEIQNNNKNKLIISTPPNELNSNSIIHQLKKNHFFYSNPNNQKEIENYQIESVTYSQPNYLESRVIKWFSLGEAKFNIIADTMDAKFVLQSSKFSLHFLVNNQQMNFRYQEHSLLNLTLSKNDPNILLFSYLIRNSQVNLNNSNNNNQNNKQETIIFQVENEEEREEILQTFLMFNYYHGQFAEMNEINGKILGPTLEITSLTERCLNKGCARFKVRVWDYFEKKYINTLIWLDSSGIQFSISKPNKKPISIHWDEVSIQTAICKQKNRLSQKLLQLRFQDLSGMILILIKCKNKHYRLLIQRCIIEFNLKYQKKNQIIKITKKLILNDHKSQNNNNNNSTNKENNKKNKQSLVIYNDANKNNNRNKNNNKNKNRNTNNNQINIVNLTKPLKIYPLEIKFFDNSEQNLIPVSINDFNQQKGNTNSRQFNYFSLFDLNGVGYICQNRSLLPRSIQGNLLTPLFIRNKSQLLYEEKLNRLINNLLKKDIIEFKLKIISINDHNKNFKSSNNLEKNQIKFFKFILKKHIVEIKNENDVIIYSEEYSNEQKIFLNTEYLKIFLIHSLKKKIKFLFSCKNSFEKDLILNCFLILKKNKLNKAIKNINKNYISNIQIISPQKKFNKIMTNYANKSIFEYNKFNKIKKKKNQKMSSGSSNKNKNNINNQTNNNHNHNNNNNNNETIFSNRNNQNSRQLIAFNQRINNKYKVLLYSSIEEYLGESIIKLHDDHFKFEFGSLKIQRFYSNYSTVYSYLTKSLYVRFVFDENIFINFRFKSMGQQREFFNTFRKKKKNYLKYRINSMTQFEILIITKNIKTPALIFLKPDGFILQTEHNLIILEYFIGNRITINKINKKICKLKFGTGYGRLLFEFHSELISNSFFKIYNNNQEKFQSLSINNPVKSFKIKINSEKYFTTLYCTVSLIIYFNRIYHRNKEKNKNSKRITQNKQNFSLQLNKIFLNNSQIFSVRENIKNARIRLQNNEKIDLFFQSRKHKQSFIHYFRNIIIKKLINFPNCFFIKLKYDKLWKYANKNNKHNNKMTFNNNNLIDNYRINFHNIKNFKKSQIEGIISLHPEGIILIKSDGKNMKFNFLELYIELNPLFNNLIKLIIYKKQLENKKKKNNVFDYYNISFLNFKNKSSFIWKFLKYKKLIEKNENTNNNIDDGDHDDDGDDDDDDDDTDDDDDNDDDDKTKNLNLILINNYLVTIQTENYLNNKNNIQLKFTDYYLKILFPHKMHLIYPYHQIFLNYSKNKNKNQCLLQTNNNPQIKIIFRDAQLRSQFISMFYWLQEFSISRKSIELQNILYYYQRIYSKKKNNELNLNLTESKNNFNVIFLNNELEEISKGFCFLDNNLNSLIINGFPRNANTKSNNANNNRTLYKNRFHNNRINYNPNYFQGEINDKNENILFLNNLDEIYIDNSWDNKTIITITDLENIEIICKMESMKKLWKFSKKFLYLQSLIKYQLKESMNKRQNLQNQMKETINQYNQERLKKIKTFLKNSSNKNSNNAENVNFIIEDETFHNSTKLDTIVSIPIGYIQNRDTDNFQGVIIFDPKSITIILAGYRKDQMDVIFQDLNLLQISFHSKETSWANIRYNNIDYAIQFNTKEDKILFAKYSSYLIQKKKLSMN
ncbi:nnp-1 protein putative nuclear protein 1 nop52 [Anaeramoeba flamelloides]|uniref:Nnp-1 protein putative nuclear protein 1 nop52 n=1 Tax=Anaeramoeba flamelloides TaxID=1746091 RepID=A0AAV7YDQ2_9EUKA|nr:nnp-1 protein putative nuclear protein 1 nop52 [Anaeramoeba flamelloides]